MKTNYFVYVKGLGRKIVQNLKDRSTLTLRLWAHHCEYILAQRARRYQQVSCFYYRLWGEQTLRILLRSFRKQLQGYFRGVLLSSIGIYAFDWESQRNKCEMEKYLNEIDQVKILKKDTLICPICKKRKVISEKFEGVQYCDCSQSNKNVQKKDGWEPYIERKNMIIWRKEEKPSLFAYKVYAKYNDINAEDFLQAQTDVEYRKQWDDTAITLEIIDTDPLDAHRSQIIYWEMKWPKLFANRDYVYYRKYIKDHFRKIIIICSKSTTHPKCPPNPRNQRVEDYWSYMVIKPFKSFDQPGLEFVLTYFDDPGLAIPSSITTWVAQKQMPEFLNKLYLATKSYVAHKEELANKLFPWMAFQVKFESDREDMKKEDDCNEQISQEVVVEDSVDSIEQPDEEIPISADESKEQTWWSYFFPKHHFT